MLAGAGTENEPRRHGVRPALRQRLDGMLRQAQNTVYMNSHLVRRKPPVAIRGRGARANVDHRFCRQTVQADPAFLESDRASKAWDDTRPGDLPETRVIPIQARSVVTRNASPDIGFDYSLNPYQGCEHGCVYCFARPTHAYHELSPGLDFETVIMAKVNAAERLAETLSSRTWQCAPIAVGVNTDAYQPAERELCITRQVLETCLAWRQPLGLITKSSLILRDLDLLSELAARRLVSVRVSVTTLDDALKRRLEPRTAGPSARLRIIEQLAAAGVPVGAMVAPVIPRINDAEMERIVEAVAVRGATAASYVLLRLPHEVEPLFRDWLMVHYPDRAAAVMSIIESCHGGRAYRAAFHQRMRGTGPFADLLAHRFEVARRRNGLDRRIIDLDTRAFRRDGGRQQVLPF